MFLNTLSGRFLLLTVAFVMLAEVLIFVPSVARYREDYLLSRLERAQIASLALLATDEMIAPELEAELLANAGVYNVVLRRDEMRQLVLSSPIPAPISNTFDLRDSSAWALMRDALGCLLDPEDQVIRVVGNPVKAAGLLIEVTMDASPLRAELLAYGGRILALSAAISIFAASLLFFAARRLLVTPIKRVVTHMTAYAEAPEDARRIIEPESKVVELREAEVALQMMQQQLTGALKQKQRLAQLGGALAKVSHDLRNILTTAQLFVDRMEASSDPAVQRAAPKLVASISRAVHLCESTLTFGKAEEPQPRLTRFKLATLVADVVEGEKLALGPVPVDYVMDISAQLTIRADQEQLYRVISNLVRNARQALEATGEAGTIEIGAGEDDAVWWIRVGDTGPGLPDKTRENLFQAFQASGRKGGSGLGLAIAAELVGGHGGQITLVRSDTDGTEFMIRLPKAISSVDPIGAVAQVAE